MNLLATDAYYTSGNDHNFDTAESNRWYQNNADIGRGFHNSSNTSPISSTTLSSKRTVASRPVKHNNPSMYARRHNNHTLESNLRRLYQNNDDVGGELRNHSILSSVSSVTSLPKRSVASIPINRNAVSNNPSVFSRKHNSNTLGSVMEHNQLCSNRNTLSIVGRNSLNDSSISSLRKLSDLNPSHTIEVAQMSTFEVMDHYAFETQLSSQRKGKLPYVLVSVQPSPFTGDQASAKIEMQFTKLWIALYEDMKHRASAPGPLNIDSKGVVWRGYCRHKHDGCHFSCKVIRKQDIASEESYFLGLYVQGHHNHHEVVKGITSTLNATQAVRSTHSPANTRIRGRHSSNQQNDHGNNIKSSYNINQAYKRIDVEVEQNQQLYTYILDHQNEFVGSEEDIIIRFTEIRNGLQQIREAHVEITINNYCDKMFSFNDGTKQVIYQYFTE